MTLLIDAGLLVITLLFGALGIRALNVQGKAHNDMITKHLAIQWQDMKGPLPPATYGLTFIYLIIAFLALMGFIISVTVMR